MIGGPRPHPRAHAPFKIGDNPIRDFGVNIAEFSHLKPLSSLVAAKQRQLLPGAA